MTKTSILILMIIFLGMPVLAMIRTLPLPQLVDSAESIVIARVVEKNVFMKENNDVPFTTASFKVEQTLKGELKFAQKIKLTAVGSEEKPMLDSPAFPKKGEAVLLFLVKKGDSWQLNNGIQGMWPIEAKTERTLGMGLRYSINQVKEELLKKGK